MSSWQEEKEAPATAWVNSESVPIVQPNFFIA